LYSNLFFQFILNTY